MRSRFDEELALLEDRMLEMGTLVETAIDMAVKAFSENDKQIAKAIEAIEDKIDKSEHDIEVMCYKLLLQQQPVARDLRRISSALKIVTDMERIGDQASDVAYIVLYSDHGVNAKYIPHIAEMAKEANIMVKMSVEAFVENDINKAQQVCEYDDKVDELFGIVKAEIIELIREDVENGGKALDFLMTAKYFERIGDHAVNIAGWSEYAVTGKLKS